VPKFPESTGRKQAIFNEGSLFYVNFAKFNPGRGGPQKTVFQAKLMQVPADFKKARAIQVSNISQSLGDRSKRYECRGVDSKIVFLLTHNSKNKMKLFILCILVCSPMVWGAEKIFDDMVVIEGKPLIFTIEKKSVKI
jgi:hypothetical protein